MVSDARKAANARWDKEHMTTVSCKVTKEKAALFRESCRKLDLVPNQVILKTINEIIQQAEGV